ncbi:aldo/keto reductase [uncultured Methanosphaera sp.]|uniref:aldo/keto reductase n=1 Tax=uncultured Methanosphaera sp. TaxID=262501 RepID=UPI000DC3BB94|nr:aldo/keto reductase [uncultured Methanosphaera sp.]RAP45700.1 MAG: 2,5-diketo-D-gluconic acid reductase [Methanosphaera sp. SHI1033]
MIDDKITLNNGTEMPCIGFGTWFLDDDVVVDAIKDATSVGYRLIDTAEAYGNEKGVGIGIKECGIPRDEIFLTTKLAAEYKDYDSASKAIDESLEKLQVDYIDLMIIHSPEPWDDFRNEDHYLNGNIEAYRALEDAYKEGKLKAIGLSNFLKEDVKNILDNCEIKPQVNQILCHIGTPSLDLIDYCQDNDIVVEAYSPIAHGAILDNNEVQKIADKYNVSLPALCVRYTMELGCIPIPKTGNIEHMKDNADVDFKISDEDMEYLKTLVVDDYGEDSMFPVFAGRNLKQ